MRDKPLLMHCTHRYAWLNVNSNAVTYTVVYVKMSRSRAIKPVDESPARNAAQDGSRSRYSFVFIVIHGGRRREIVVIKGCFFFFNYFSSFFANGLVLSITSNPALCRPSVFTGLCSPHDYGVPSFRRILFRTRITRLGERKTTRFYSYIILDREV